MAEEAAAVKATGVLLINLGTPKTPSIWAIRKYLRQFLSDFRVVDIPRFFRLLLLYCVILPFRPRRIIAGYRAIWQEGGSPLLFYSQSLQHKLAHKLGGRYRVALGMRYGEPSLPAALHELRDTSRLLVLPLYPHYAASSTSTALDEVYRGLAAQWDVKPIRVLEAFYAHPDFVRLWARRIREQLDAVKWDHLLFSYHGLPQRHLTRSGCPEATRSCIEAPCRNFSAYRDRCYRQQCFVGTDAITSALGIEAQRFSVAFQSRLGRTPWIRPFTDQMLPKLRATGVMNLVVCAPSFVADCLETSDEIAIRLRAQWQALGGESFHMVPSLNDDDEWVSVLEEMVNTLENPSKDGF